MTKRDLPLNLFAWCCVIFVASFMPWGISGRVTMPFFGATLTQTANGWNGSISLLSILIPNWIVVVIAVALTVIAWLRVNAVDIKPKASFLLALYGAFHALVFIYAVSERFGQIGIGSLATLVAFVAILLSLRKPKIVLAANP